MRTSAAPARSCGGCMPDAFVALSSEVLPEFREFERLSTTVINAYAGPRMARYLAGFARAHGGARHAGRGPMCSIRTAG